ncbi:hypothetical protein B296_00019988 [Ensete ventricosum]|uniref:Uncharacterized protein n=1 Tax=Ensete ventricosum TaxID=4639 RepID=A0A427AY39_ENSVE|nr:hypothetical protein B296_00019988 [Ensete ventricosum]
MAKHGCSALAKWVNWRAHPSVSSWLTWGLDMAKRHKKSPLDYWAVLWQLGYLQGAGSPARQVGTRGCPARPLRCLSHWREEEDNNGALMPWHRLGAGDSESGIGVSASVVEELAWDKIVSIICTPLEGHPSGLFFGGRSGTTRVRVLLLGCEYRDKAEGQRLGNFV